MTDSSNPRWSFELDMIKKLFCHFLRIALYSLHYEVGKSAYSTKTAYLLELNKMTTLLLTIMTRPKVIANRCFDVSCYIFDLHTVASIP